MTPISNAMQTEIWKWFRPIRFRSDEATRVYIGHQDFPRQEIADDTHLQKLTDDVLKVFRRIERAVNEAVWAGKGPEDALTLDEDTGYEYRKELARFGRRAYRRLFNEEARETLKDILAGDSSVTPTFVSEVIPFPWEVLYEGEDYQDAQAEHFWGIKYTPARILQPDRSLPKHTLKQPPPSDMLFCLHAGLKHARTQEWEQVRDLLLSGAPSPKFQLLASSMCAAAAAAEDGEGFLEYLDAAPHNMLHFACHCQPTDKVVPGRAGEDQLLISVIKDHEAISETERPLTLQTGCFEDISGRFQREPFIFLNACQSGASADDVRKSYNLPRMFMQRGAGSVIATACPVPDVFAAAFARVFYEQFLIPEKVKAEGTDRELLVFKTVGEALRNTRQHFLDKDKYNNPLGLAYGLYSPACYGLQPQEPSELV
jgi:hypothetical protein